MGFYAVIALDRGLVDDHDALDTAVSALLGHDSHLDGVRHSPAATGPAVLIATVHSTETAIVTVDDTAGRLAFRTGVASVGAFGTPVAAVDADGAAGPVDPDGPGIVIPWTHADIRRAAREGIAAAPDPDWPDGPGRFLIGIREEPTRHGQAAPAAVGDAVRTVLARRAGPKEAAICSWGNAVWNIGFLPTGGSTTLIGDTNICLPMELIAAEHPDWWARIGLRIG